MYGNANEENLINYKCNGCGRIVKQPDLVYKYDDTLFVTGFDGKFQPKLMWYCKECAK